MPNLSDLLYLGVDAGGTRTTAVAGTTDSRVLGRSQAGPGNPAAVGVEAAVGAIVVVVQTALAEAGGGTATQAARLVAGVAGVGQGNFRADFEQALRVRLAGQVGPIAVVRDVDLVLPAAGLRWGVALAAGTGSVALGVSQDGREALVGGWGYLLGDEGSAFDVGREALRALARAADAGERLSSLHAAVLGTLGTMEAREGIHHKVYGSATPRVLVAGLAPLVAAYAAQGDVEARAILADAGERLAALAATAARRLPREDRVAVVASGGLFAAGQLVLGPLRERLQVAGIEDVRLLETGTEIGALRLAARPSSGASTDA